ncbi:complex I NDUFA9 subunit family protein [Pseudooceanicola marinus]|uniref:complex I NDUFA9 subunit family protein n=1 Tax=Pseudooceanicola marinus TaxID=396013 RepID=UPI001CD50F8A|nr:complex I NDUFA9 subunit family protein [Pseudooceanicola marinus]MCA1336139.1 complex I NDUFA9 subunit family protein [Pseudooceanicola marinus]
MPKSKLVTIFGGSGFVGRYIARRMAQQGWRVRVAVRNPALAGFVRPYGAVGQVEPVFCNIRDDASVEVAMRGSDAVVNCVGTFAAKGKNNFDAVQADGAGRIARVAAAQGVANLVHISALGADAEGGSGYARSKGEGEAAVLAAYPEAMILRPSVIFGYEDKFFNRFGKMASRAPVVPVIGADTKFQPVWVDDVAAAAVMGVLGQAPGGIYELGGPEVKTFRGWMKEMFGVIHRRRGVLALPFWVGSVMAGVLGLVETLTLGLVTNSVLTSDQVKQLRHDNVVTGEANTFADLGIDPAAPEAVLPDYLWTYRPSGQYAAIKDSAQNLKA